MRFAIISKEGDSFVLWRRLHDEGHEVLVYIVNPHVNKIGLGLVPKTTSYEGLCMWGAAYADTIYIFDFTGMGEKADALRKRGCLVVGGGTFCDRLEQDRGWGEKFATDNGVAAPFTVEHTHISQSIAWLRSHDDGRGWYFKPHKNLGADSTQSKSDVEGMVRYLESMQHKYGDRVTHILQEKLDGIDISTACYWNGRSFIGPYEGTVERKKFMNGDIGPATGCSFNVVWFYQDYPRICEELHWNEFSEKFRQAEAPPGIYDVNGFISKEDGRVHFLEWTPRFGYDSEPTAWRLLLASAGETFANLANGRASEMPFDTTRCAMSVRLSISPYPWENVEDIPPKKTCVGTTVDGLDGLWEGCFMGYGIGVNEFGELIVQDPLGIVGMAAADGTDLEEMHERIMDFVEELDISGLQYRTDAAKCLSEHIEEIRDLEYEVPVVQTMEG